MKFIKKFLFHHQYAIFIRSYKFSFLSKEKFLTKIYSELKTSDKVRINKINFSFSSENFFHEHLSLTKLYQTLSSQQFFSSTRLVTLNSLFSIAKIAVSRNNSAVITTISTDIRDI